MIVDSRTGKILVTREQMFNYVKDYLDKMDNEEFCKRHGILNEKEDN